MIGRLKLECWVEDWVYQGADGGAYAEEETAIEADCLLCHMPEYDLKARNDELAKLNFRWAATAGAGLGKVDGSVAVGKKPTVAYDKSKFGADGNLLVHMTPSPHPWSP